MKVAFNPETEKRIRSTVKPGDPWALDFACFPIQLLSEKICSFSDKNKLHFIQIIPFQNHCKTAH